VEYSFFFRTRGGKDIIFGMKDLRFCFRGKSGELFG
jgi:hypothetical protein